MWRLLFLLLSSNILNTVQAAECPLENGDLVFIKSQTSQSALLKIATGSEWSHVGMAFNVSGKWQIIEAVQPVKWTSLLSFVTRSRHYHFEVHRPNFSFDSDLIKKFAEKQLDKDYDLIFSMDNERWYCSELIWKAYVKGANVEIGSLEKIGDLKVDNMKVMNEAKKRFTGYGMTFNEEEWKNSDVITPVQMMKSDKVFKVFDNDKIDDLRNCLKSKVQK